MIIEMRPWELSCNGTEQIDKMESFIYIKLHLYHLLRRRAQCSWTGMVTEGLWGGGILVGLCEMVQENVSMWAQCKQAWRLQNYVSVKHWEVTWLEWRVEGDLVEESEDRRQASWMKWHRHQAEEFLFIKRKINSLKEWERLNFLVWL